MNDHLYRKELTALAAAGYLSDEECRELRNHLAVCPECRNRERAFGDLVRCLWPSRSSLHESVNGMKFTPAEGIRERFLERAEREGVRFSSRVKKKTDGPERV
jgi:anti-sigma factor RsiW